MKTAQEVMPKIVGLFLLLTVLYISCEEKTKQNPDQEGEETTVTKRPGSIVDIDEARVLYKTYGDRRVDLIQGYENAINKEKGLDDKFYVARYVQFDYKTIKQYIAYIEQQSEAAKVDISSLRVYFANNPEDSTGLIHPRQNSVMLSPTTKHDEGEYLYYIDDAAQETPKAVLLDWNFEPLPNESQGTGALDDKTIHASVLPNLTSNSINAVLPPDEDDGSLTLNRGNSAPPPPFD